MLYNVFCGGVILNGFFMATDYTTSPITSKGQILFGVGCGALTAAILFLAWSVFISRHYGGSSSSDDDFEDFDSDMPFN